MNQENYLSINKESWNKRVEPHVKSDFYDMENFLKGKNSLNFIELNLLGEISRKSILHLQCHFGQDSISLSRMGAKVTGIDLSDKAIETAQNIAQQLGTDTRFICSDVYDLPNVLDEKFDIVFTSYGTIGWLPDLDKWADVISHFLKPNGKLIFVEFHPVIWMYDNDFTKVAYNYFKDEPIEETQEGTYAEKDADIQIEYVSWNHSLSEVFSALLNKGLQIKSFQEFDYSPYNCFNKTIEFEKGKFRIEPFGNKIPMVYALEAIKKS